MVSQKHNIIDSPGTGNVIYNAYYSVAIVDVSIDAVENNLAERSVKNLVNFKNGKNCLQPSINQSTEEFIEGTDL